MVAILSPVRIVRSRRTSFTNVEETQEIDFSLGLQQGIRVHGVEFGMSNVVPVPGDDAIVVTNAQMSLHIETGGLEGAIDAFPADTNILNSEILAQTTLQVMAFTSSIPSTSPDVFNMIWLQPTSWSFHDIVGGPIDLAQNLTFRVVTSAATLVVNGGQVTIYYQYIKLTDAELGQQFALRR